MTFRKKLANLSCYFNNDSKKKIKIKYLYYNKLNMLFKKLITEGYIYGFKIVNSELTVFCKPTFQRYKLKFITTNKRFLSYYQLESLIYKNPLTTFFVSTPVGILENKKIISLKLGGYLILILKAHNVNL